MTEYFKIRNYRSLIIRYHGPTNHRGSRFSITDEDIDGNKIIRYFPWSYEYNGIGEMAYKKLIDAGFNVVCKSQLHDRDILLIDNWGEDWKDISIIK